MNSVPLGSFGNMLYGPMGTGFLDLLFRRVRAVIRAEEWPIIKLNEDS